jgi:hypothetical protein
MGPVAPPLFPRLRWVGLVWLAVWVPTYVQHWGARNFLQLCDVAVFLTCLGMWRGHALLLSTQAVATTVVNGIWVVDVGGALLTGRHVLGGTEYMWDASRPLWVRLLSLFHLALPVLLLYCLRRTGYRRAWPAATALAAVVFVASRLFGDPTRNHNFVFRDPFFNHSWGPAIQHLSMTLLVFVGMVFIPTHLLLQRWLGGARR